MEPLHRTGKTFIAVPIGFVLARLLMAVVVSRKPELFYLRSHHQGFIIPLSHNIDCVLDSLRQGNAKYVILDNFKWASTTRDYLFPAIVSSPKNFTVVYSVNDPETCVLELKQ